MKTREFRRGSISLVINLHGTDIFQIYQVGHPIPGKSFEERDEHFRKEMLKDLKKLGYFGSYEEIASRWCDYYPHVSVENTRDRKYHHRRKRG